MSKQIGSAAQSACKSAASCGGHSAWHLLLISITYAVMPHRTLSEFALIARYFQRPNPLRHAVLGVGDDCALLQPPAGELLAISTDTLVAGRHFFDDVDPATLGHKTLAVNLSDLAASGAQPLACTLALTVPAVDDAWLAAFARGLYALVDASGCELIGGDTTRGPLSITLTVWGSVPQGQALLRSGARAGDDIYVSYRAGQGLGDARLALHLLQAQRDICHILHASGVGATLHAVSDEAAPFADAVGYAGTNTDAARHGLLAASSPALRSLGAASAMSYVLAGGDDYELLFTASPEQRARILQIARQTGLHLTRIGCIDSESGLRLRQMDGRCVCISANGFDHFAAR